MRADRTFFLMAALMLTAAGAAGQVTQPGQISNPHAGTEEMTDYCTECHACAEPTQEDPCLIACPRHGGQFRGAHRVDEGPEVVIIDQLADLYEPVVFNHNLHASMSMFSGGCANCHHYSEEGGKVHIRTDKAGVWGANDPDCRKPMLWDDIVFEDEVTNAAGSKRRPDKVECNATSLRIIKS